MITRNRDKPQGTDWHKFWILEVLLLAISTEVAVFATGGRRPIGPAEAAMLLALLVFLTVLNLSFAFLRATRFRPKSPVVRRKTLASANWRKSN
jgi:hypothetical protein